MGLGARLRRVEKRASGHVTIVRCPTCGFEVRAAGDLALLVLAAAWARETGTEYEPNPAVAFVLEHPHEALLAAVLDDIPGVARAE